MTTHIYSKQKQLIYTVLLLVVLGAFICGALSGILRKETWNEARILDALNVAIPTAAINILYEGEWQGYTRYLRLQFEADPATMRNFTRTFCTSILHPGYDPFNAIRVVEPVQHPGTIRIDYSTNVNQQPVTLIFYSYSPVASGNLWGNRCLTYDKNGDLTGSVLLRIDRSKPTQYSILLEYYAHHYAHPISLNALDVRPIRDMPILARGLLYAQSRNRYLLHPDDMLCLEVDPLAYLSDDEDWQWLSGSIAQITIDGKQLPEAYISSLGTLTPKYNPEGTLFDENERYFNYCYYEEWEDGEHAIEIFVTDLATNSFTYDWTFYTE